MAGFTIGDYDYTIVSGTTNVSMKVHDTSKTSYADPTGTVTYNGVTYTVTNMNGCFYLCANLTTPPDLSNMTAVTSMINGFYGCESLTSPPNMSNMTAVTSMYSCFSFCTSLTSPPDMSNMTAVTDMTDCFYGCTSLAVPPVLANPSVITNMMNCFRECTSLVTAPNMLGLNPNANVTNCFRECIALRGFLKIDVDCSNSRAANLFRNMDNTGATTDPLYLVVPAADRSKWDIYSKPSRVQLISGNESNMTVTMAPYDYTYSTDENGQLTSLACKVNSSYKTQTSYPPIDSAVTDMAYCFYGCTSLLVPPDMSNMTTVTDMSNCFNDCTSLTTSPDLSNMTAVMFMKECFWRCTNLTTPPDMSNMTAVTDMSYCFCGCASFTTPPDMSNLTAVTNMDHCFAACSNLIVPPDLSGMTAVTNMSYCFASCTSLTTPPNLSNMTAVTNMSDCFSRCTGLTIPPDLSDLTAVTNMESCFEVCSSLKIPPDLSNLTAVTNMEFCFAYCDNLIVPPDLSNMTALVKMGACFRNCYNLRGFLKIGTTTSPEDLKGLWSIFGNAALFEDLYLIVPSSQRTNWTNFLEGYTRIKVIASDTVSDVDYNFGYDAIVYHYTYYTDSNGQLTSLNCVAINAPVHDGTYYDFPPIDLNATDLAGCFARINIAVYPWQERYSNEPNGLKYPSFAGLRYVSNLGGCFSDCVVLTIPPDLSNMTAVTNMGDCFYNCYSLATPPDMSNMTAVTNMNSCFDNCTSLTSPPDMSNMTAVTNMYSCFSGCISLTSPPDMSNMTAVTNMNYCFYNCYSLATPPDMSNMTAVTSMHNCFEYCSSLATPPNMSNMTAVTDMSYCFHHCDSLLTPPDLSNMTAVTDMSACFHSCTGFTTPPDMSSMTSVTGMNSCFSGCVSLTTPPDMSNMTAVTDMSACFHSCTGFTTPPDMSNMTAVTDMRGCFYGCANLATPPDLSDLTAITDMAYCFGNCTALSGDLHVGSRVLSSGANAFSGTAGNIWIVPTEDVTGTGTASVPASSGDAAWFNLYGQGNGMPSNVHFYSPYLNAAPTSGLSVQRIEGFDGYFIEASTGAILLETVAKPQVYATRVKAMPTVRKISLWVGSAEDEQYIRERLSIDEDVGYTEVRQVLYDQNPSALGYYEYDSANDTYVSTSDTSPVSGKKYYSLVVGEALSRGLGFTKILYRPNPDAPDDLALLRMGDLSLYTNGDYVDMALAPSTLTFDRFYAFLTRDTTTQVVALLVEDSCHNVSKYVVKIPKSFATFSFLKPGGGVGVGVPARREGFDVDMQTFFEHNPMVYDIPTLPVVVTYASDIADDAHLPDPCLVIRLDPGYLWSRANPSAPIPNDGFQIYLRGSMLERLPQRAGRAFVTTPPLSGGGTGWTVLGSAMGEAKVDTYLPGSVPVSSSQADRWSPASGAGQLLVSVTGCEKVTVEFQNGNDSDGTGGAHFELYEIDTSYVQGAVPVATSTSDESYTFTHLECKPHTFEVRPVPDSSQHSSETTAPTAYVRILPDPER